MNVFIRQIRRYLILGLFPLLVLAGCMRPSPSPVTTAVPYLPETGESRLSRYAPIFWIEENAKEHNRIGAVRAANDDTVFIDPDTAVIYAEERAFSTARAEYTNLIYRVHFPGIPGGFSPYFLGAGKNVGLLVVLTLNAQGQPLLITSVHSCGCYLAFVPTSYLPPQARPENWPHGRQRVLFESLPASLNYPPEPAEPLRVQVGIRSGNHRVMDVWLAPSASAGAGSVSTRLEPLKSLQRLPYGQNKTTSFYETAGRRRGHVRGSYKTRERFLMSWWAFDWYIGQDKYLGQDKQHGPVFYTSLKPWARKASDMRDFAEFLSYWGWEL